MNTTAKINKRRFSAADVLISVIVLALIIGATVLFLFPHEEESTAVEKEVTMVIHLQETPVGLSAGDKLFDGEAEIGTVSKIDKRANNVIVNVNVMEDGGVYSLGGKSVRVNGGFVLETKLRRADGMIESITEKGV